MKINTRPRYIVLAVLLTAFTFFAIGYGWRNDATVHAATNYLTIDDGSVARPALAYEAEKGTGMYRSGSGTNVLTSLGVAKLTIGSGVTANGALTVAAGATMSAGSNVTLDSGTATATSGAATLNKQSGTITTEALTTAAGAAYTLTLTNSVVTAATRVSVSVDNGSNSQGIPVVGVVTPGSGQVVIKVYNLHATQALNGTLKISFNAWL